MRVLWSGPLATLDRPGSKGAQVKTPPQLSGFSLQPKWVQLRQKQAMTTTLVRFPLLVLTIRLKPGPGRPNQSLVVVTRKALDTRPRPGARPANPKIIRLAGI